VKLVFICIMWFIRTFYETYCQCNLVHLTAIS